MNNDRIDLSIPSLDKDLKNDPVKIKKWLGEYHVVTEKFDGVKITLWRNYEQYDHNDYTKNWVIAYKNRVFSVDEFKHLDRELVKKHSIGMSQLVFVHDFIKENHKGAWAVPPGYEFFFEFIQNKPTITRDYTKFHEMFLIDHASSDGIVEGGLLKTIPGPEKKSYTFFDVYNASTVFKGKFVSEKDIENGLIHFEQFNTWNKVKGNVDWDNPLSVYDAIKKVFLESRSLLGGLPEGVVFNTNGKLTKIQQLDQLDKKIRYAKKQRYIADDPSVEEVYWKQINEKADELCDSCSSLEELGKQVYSFTGITHPKKHFLNVQDDLMVTARECLIAKLPENQNAVYMGRFQPLTKAHTTIIRYGATYFHKLYLVIVRAEKEDKERNPFDLETQLEMVEALGFGNKIEVVVIKTGLLSTALGKIKDNITAVLAGDDRDEYRKQIKNPRIQLMTFPRLDDSISATKVRKALKENNFEAFQSLTDETTHEMYENLRRIIG